MHDIRAIRENPAAFDAGLALRNLPPASPRSCRWMPTAAPASQRRGRAGRAEPASKEAGAAKGRGDEAEFERLRALVSAKKAESRRCRPRPASWTPSCATCCWTIPNLPLDRVPPGKDETDNVEIRRWGSRARFDFTPREHFEIEGVKPGMDFETAAKLSGARFVVLQGGVARIQRALAQFMLDLHVAEHGLTETWAPVLVLSEMMEGTGQLPKFGEDSYQTREGWWLIPTSEVTLTNTVNGDLVEPPACPAAWSPIASASGPRPAAPGAIPPGCCASTSSRRSRWSRSPMPRRRGRTCPHDPLRRGVLEAAGPALPHHRAVRRRYGLWRPHHP
jgi:seryl-tRNA synthetase